MLNKNKQGIDNILTSSKLIQKDKPTFLKINPILKNQQSNYFNPHSLNHQNYHYHLLNQNDNDNNHKLENIVVPQSQKKNFISGNSNQIKEDQPKDAHPQASKILEIEAPAEKQLNQNNQYQPQKTIKHSQTQRQNREKQISVIPNKHQKAKSQKMSSSNKNRNPSHDQFSELEPGGQIPLQQQSHNTSETVVVKSSLKYFNSCRGQAADYIAKMQSILAKDKSYLSKSLSKIRQSIDEAHLTLAQKLKQYLYRVVDESVNKWKQFSLQKFYKLEINYIGELLQMITQVEQRCKQISTYRNDLDDQKYWKKRASDLLTANYQSDVIQLSELSKKSVECSQENVKHYVQGMNDMMVVRVEQKQFESVLIEKIFQYLINGENTNQKQDQQVPKETNKKQINNQNNETSQHEQNNHKQTKKNQKSICNQKNQPPQIIAACQKCFHLVLTSSPQQIPKLTRIKYQQSKNDYCPHSLEPSNCNQGTITKQKKQGSVKKNSKFKNQKNN